MNTSWATVPTDNLYKFIAIFGLILLIFSNSYIFISITDLDRERVILEGDISSFKIQSKNLIEQINSFFEKIKNFEPEIDKAITANNNRKLEKYRKLFVMYKEEFKSIEKNILETELKANELNTKNKLLAANIEKIMLFRSIWKLSSLLGFILIISGFTLWYYKLQKYLDKQVSQNKKIK